MSVSTVTPYQAININKRQFYNNDDCMPSGDFASHVEDDASKQMMEPSTSRLKNAFQRLRGNSMSKANHIAPAEIIKPTVSKSSLAEKIKIKFQSNKSNMTRSTSFSSGWSKFGNKQQTIVRSTSVHLYHKRTSKRKVSFAKLVSVRETFSRIDYDRVSDPYAICNRLTPTIAQQIKEELNAYKLHEMQVHEYSRIHTHFFI